jgi:hypothetical protein
MCLTICVLMVVAISLSGQSRYGETGQTVFEEEQAFQHPISLPDAVFDILKRDKQTRACFERYPELKEVPAAWFSAARVDISSGRKSDGIIVKSKKLCLGIAGAGWFWIFLHQGTQYELVLSEGGQSLEVQHSRRNQYRDIVVAGATPGTIYSRKFRFHNGKYQLSSHTSRAVVPSRK